MYWCYDRSQKTCNIKRENPYCSSIFMPFVNPQRIKNLSQTWTLVQVPFKRFWGTWSPKTFLEALKCYKTNQRVFKKVFERALDFLKVFRVRYPRNRLRLFMFFWKIRFWWKWRWSYVFCLWSDTAAFVFLITYSPYRVFSFGLGVQAKPSRSRMMAQHRSSRVM